MARLSPFATFDVAVGGVRMDGAAMAGADLATDGRLRFVAGDRVAALTALDRGGAVDRARRPSPSRDGLHLDDESDPDRRRRPHAARPRRRHRRADAPGRGRRIAARRLDRRDVRLGVAGADAFAVRFAAGHPAAAQRRPFAAEPRSLALELVDRSTGSRAPSATRSTASSGCSTPWPSWR